MNFNFKGVTTATWVRIIALFIILVNQVGISLFDFTLLPFSDEEVYEGVSVIVTIVASLWVGWKNNSLTKEAQEADRKMHMDKEMSHYK